MNITLKTLDELNKQYPDIAEAIEKGEVPPADQRTDEYTQRLEEYIAKQTYIVLGGKEDNPLQSCDDTMEQRIEGLIKQYPDIAEAIEKGELPPIEERSDEFNQRLDEYLVKQAKIISRGDNPNSSTTPSDPSDLVGTLICTYYEHATQTATQTTAIKLDNPLSLNSSKADIEQAPAANITFEQRLP